MMDIEVISDVKRDFIYKLLEKGQRIDGRGFEEMRNFEIQRNAVNTAEGSAMVTLGNTRVVVGVKVSTGEPYPDTPDEGVFTVNAELIPMASPSFESGPPRPEAIELARVVDRGIRESKTIDFKKLCISEGEKVWVIFVDIHVLDFDGNLFDACTMGVLGALDNTVLPGTLHEAGPDVPLSVEHWPISVTFSKLGKHVVVDPCRDEEIVSEGRITITTDENGDIRAVQKGMGSGFTLDEIRYAVETSARIGKEIREKAFSLKGIV